MADGKLFLFHAGIAGTRGFSKVALQAPGPSRSASPWRNFRNSFVLMMFYRRPDNGTRRVISRPSTPDWEPQLVLSSNSLRYQSCGFRERNDACSCLVLRLYHIAIRLRDRLERGSAGW